jgi:hypothetical protein
LSFQGKKANYKTTDEKKPCTSKLAQGMGLNELNGELLETKQTKRVLRAACCVLRAACCVLRAARCVLRAA